MSASTGEESVRAHILVSGRVQGVGYRAFAYRVAKQRGLVGGVRNLDDGRVELDVEGRRSVIEALVVDLKVGPPAARVGKVDLEWSAATERFSQFTVWY
jgi:acylphosphatase